jgi:hypothetical protein
VSTMAAPCDAVIAAPFVSMACIYNTSVILSLGVDDRPLLQDRSWKRAGARVSPVVGKG